MAESARHGGKEKQKEKNSQKEKKKRADGSTPRAPDAQIITSIGLMAIRNEARKNAEAAEARMAEGNTLPAVLGTVLNKSDASLQSVLREWHVYCLET